MQKRFDASSIVLNESTLWVVGGEDRASYLKSTEFIFIDQPPIRGPDLPISIRYVII